MRWAATPTGPAPRGERTAGAAASARRLHKGPSSTAAPSPRPPTLVTAGTWLVRLARHARDGRAGHGGALASFCSARLLALEESSPLRTTPDSRRAATADPVRIATEHPRWGAVRIVGELRALGFEVSARTVSRYRRQALRRVTAEPVVAHVSPQPRVQHLGRRSVHGPDARLPHALRAHRDRPRPAPHPALERHGASERALDLAADDRGDRLGSAARVPDPPTATVAMAETSSHALDGSGSRRF